MIKKPDVLSDERIEQIRNNYSFSGMSGILYAKTISQAQRDADVKHYEPLINEMYEALKALLFQFGVAVDDVRSKDREVCEQAVKALNKVE